MIIKIKINYHRLSQTLVFYKYMSDLKLMFKKYPFASLLKYKANTNRRLLIYYYEFAENIDLDEFSKNLANIADGNYYFEVSTVN